MLKPLPTSIRRQAKSNNHFKAALEKNGSKFMVEIQDFSMCQCVWLGCVGS